jgi:hypothetical protein
VQVLVGVVHDAFSPGLGTTQCNFQISITASNVNPVRSAASP